MSAYAINITLLVLLFTLGPLCIGMWIAAGRERAEEDEFSLRMIAEAEAFRRGAA
jgi:hypothetical protein